MKYLSYIKNIFIIFAIFEYFNILSHSEASYMPYILWGILGICAIIYNKYTNNNNINNISKVGAVLFSVMISFVNYKAIYKSIYYWKQYIDYIFLIKYIVFFIGIYVLFVNIIDLILKNKFKITLYKNVINNDKFIYYYMIFIFVVYNLVYILGFYPGILTYDSMSQLTQVINNNYSNHHPVSHTYLIGFVFSLFKNQPNNNLAIFAFCEMQIIIFMLMHAYAYFVAKANKSLNILLVLLPLLNIINIFYSFTLWKDILFNYAIFLFVVEIFKLLNEKSIKIYDYAIIIITSFCICLFRSNGLIALFLFFIMSLVYIYIYIYSRKANKIQHNKNINIVLYIVGVVLVVCSILINSVHNDEKIEKVSIVESLSIPIQQMSRVIVDGNIIDDEDAKLIEKVIPIEEVKNLYLNNVSDPVKFYISRNKTDGIIIENKYEFLKLYIKWLFKYKTSYIKAFIDETNGYYNGSYSKNWLVEAVYVGIEKVNINFEPISKSFYKSMIALIYFWTNSDLTSIFIGLGFNFFIFVLLVLKTIYNKKNLIPYFLVISVFITLVLATPVWSEYRYFYSLILTLPFYLSINTN